MAPAMYSTKVQGAVENPAVSVGAVENPDGSVSHGSVSPANCPRGGRRSRTAIVRLSLEKEDDEFVKFDVPVDNDYKSLVFRPGKYL